MELYEIIMSNYPELTLEDFGFDGSIELQDDSDGLPAYIFKWNYTKPIPAGLNLGK